MKPHSAWSFSKTPVKFKIPTADNLVPIRLDIEIDGQRLRDAFLWNPSGIRICCGRINASVCERTLGTPFSFQPKILPHLLSLYKICFNSRLDNIDVDNQGGIVVLSDDTVHHDVVVHRGSVVVHHCVAGRRGGTFYRGYDFRFIHCTSIFEIMDPVITYEGDPDTEVGLFAKRTVKDLKLPPAFVTQIAQSIQSQLADFRSYEGQDMFTGEKVVPIKLDLRVNHTLVKDHFLWDLNNFESDPEEFARTFCKDMGIEDPEVGPAIAISIREQLYEISVQSVASARESKMHKKGRRGFEHFSASKTGVTGVDLVKLFGNKNSVVRKRRDWDVYEPIVDLLSVEEVDALETKEERIAR